MKAVYRKEMRQYFHSVIGYVFLAIFVFINAFYFLLQNLLTRSGDITDYFRATITLEMFLMPMLTMRSFSEEKKQKTDLLLYTVPVDCSQVVLAKFLAAETMFLLGLAVTVAFPVILAMCGSVQIWITLGNYIGAVRNWALLQSDYDCLYMVADLHSLTVRQVPADLRRRTRELAALLLAVGIDPKEHVLFVQSHVPAHTELAWVLACNTQFGELSRMTQFKDKSAKHPDNVNGGLFTYPVLMAADILIYNADLVPVGQDQTQHLEIARDIAGRFNGIYGDTFTLPEGYVPAAGAKIMSLAEPTKKMSKSDTNINSFILMTDDKDAIVRKFKRAVTDSDGVVRFDRETKPGVSNLMCIYSTFTGKSNDEIAAEFEGKGYGDFKLAVAEVTADALAPVQAEYARILADKAYVDEVLKNGAERASRLANRTVSKVYRKVGLLQLDK